MEPRPTIPYEYFWDHDEACGYRVWKEQGAVSQWDKREGDWYTVASDDIDGRIGRLRSTCSRCSEYEATHQGQEEPGAPRCESELPQKFPVHSTKVAANRPLSPQKVYRFTWADYDDRPSCLKELQQFLDDGWRIIGATPHGGAGIVYILEKVQ